ncbi:hypothetical protein DFP72DRAFT_867341 [Ephemerocybe angulata]|uniref:RING-type domain-containing protein n=1 Tax=Ephemerocybe angulata TaxID=980116 RepID=A0A8H6IJ88_9AGAR|nr:hypothetical protein DFP72DRAFT_867341 [Tulosesus angulatus]
MPPAEPLWYCHEVLSNRNRHYSSISSHLSTASQMENPEDDPREFAHGDDLDGQDPPPGLDTFLLGLQSLMDRGMAPGGTAGPRPQPRPDGSVPTSRFSFQVTSNNGVRTMTFGAPRRNSAGADRVPTASEFMGPQPSEAGAGGDRITGPMMAQYLLALLGNRDPLTAMLAGGMGGPGGPESGRMGDYVFNQEALDEIITQLMENSNAHRPVPATDEIMNKLPREILMENSATLQKDCAVCKEQFKLGTEDPDEQVVITLPCQHPFHEPCILPWLKSSGTCPVCRFALVPQPDSQGTPQGNPSGSSPTSPSGSNRPASPRPSSPSSSPSNRGSQSGPGGFIQNILGAFTGHHPHSNPGGSHRPASASPPRSPPRRSGTNSSSHQSRSGNTDHLPGGWADDLD